MMHAQMTRLAPLPAVLLLATIAVAAVFVYAPVAGAVERPIPTAVNIRAYAAEQGGQLDVLVRMPLGAVKNVQFPVRPDTQTLDLAQMQTMLAGIAEHWVAANFEVRDRGVVIARPGVVAARLSIISDASFNSFALAHEHFAAAPLATSEEVLWQQVWLDTHLRYPLASGAHVVTIEPHVAQLGVNVTTQLTLVDERGERALTFEGDPGAIFFSPRWRDTAAQFIGKGVSAVIGTADIAVFVFCLALPFRRLRDVLPATATFVSSLLVALIAVRSGLVSIDLWWRTLFDVLAAVALLLVAAANVINRVTPRRRALLALVAGLIFGCLSALRLEDVLQYAGDNRTLAGASYCIGMALVIVALIVVSIPLLRFLFSFGRAETLERIIVAALAADTAWGWLVERGELLQRIPLSPRIEEGMASAVTLAVFGAALLGAVLWLVNRWLKSLGFAEEAVRTSSESP